MSHDILRRAPSPTQDPLYQGYRREIGRRAMAESGVIKRELERAKQQVEYLEFVLKHDHLTNVLNRHGVLEVAEQKITTKYPVPFGLMAFDLDAFKKVNDTMGHDYGDEVLITVGGRLRQVFSRGSDSILYHDRLKERPELGAGDSEIARMGGDEFLGFIDARAGENYDFETPEGRQEWKEDTTLRVRTALDPVFSSLPKEVQELGVGASMGLALWIPGEMDGTWQEQFSVLAREADHAAMADKRSRGAER
jgi:GGDEF domain-containing protein